MCLLHSTELTSVSYKDLFVTKCSSKVFTNSMKTIWSKIPSSLQMTKIKLVNKSHQGNSPKYLVNQAHLNMCFNAANLGYEKRRLSIFTDWGL